MLTQTAKPVGHQHEAKEAEEHRVELFEAGEDPTVAFAQTMRAITLGRFRPTLHIEEPYGQLRNGRFRGKHDGGATRAHCDEN